MKMKRQKVDFDTLEEFYRPSRLKVNDDGKVLIKNVGPQRPNIELELPGFEVPLQDGIPVNLLEGFLMPKVVELLNLPYQFLGGEKALLCQYTGIREISTFSGVLQVRLSDPENSDAIIFSASSSDRDDIMPRRNDLDLVKGYIWQDYSYQCRRGRTRNIREYIVLPLGYRYLGKGVGQTPEDFAQTKAEMIRLANEYLGITDETKDSLAINSESDSKLDSDAGSAIEPQNNPLADIPGFDHTDGADYRIWTYCDEISYIDAFVVDRYGRLLKPELEDHRDLFEAAKLAGFKAWQNVPKGALVLECRRPNRDAEFETIVHQQAEELTAAQVGRVQLLQCYCARVDQAYELEEKPYPDWKFYGQ